MKRQDKMSEVLIVDDDHNFREPLRELLSDAGYQTCIASNAEEGIALLQTTAPDLTLCDWKMPGGGGEQFLKSLQSEGLLTTMPVIILTAHGTGPNAMQAMQLGARHGSAGNPAYGIAARGRGAPTTEVRRSLT